MPKTKFEIALSIALVAVIAGLVWWKFFSDTPEQKFLKEVRKVVQSVNDGDYAPVQAKFSPEFIRFLGEQSYNAQQAVMLVRRLDMEQRAVYSQHKLTVFEPGRFAEVEFIRQTGDDKSLFTLPFIYRQGTWWITDHFESKKTWDFPSL